METNFLEMLKSSDETDRRYALEDIASAQEWAFVPHVIPLLEDNSVAVREAAAEVLVHSKDKQGIQWAVSSLASDKVKTRNLAAEILMGIGEAAVEELTQAGFTHADPDVRKLSLDIIGTMTHLRRNTHQDLFNALDKLISDENVNVLCSVIEAYGVFKDDHGVPLLLKAMSGSEWVQCCIVEALISIGTETSSHALQMISKKVTTGPAKSRVDSYLAVQDKSGKAS